MKSSRLDLARQLTAVVTALLPTLSQVGKIGSEFALAPTSGHALRKGSRTYRAMDHLAADVQVPGNRTLAESLTMQCNDLLIPSQTRGATDLPTLLCYSQRARS